MESIIISIIFMHGNECTVDLVLSLRILMFRYDVGPWSPAACVGSVDGTRYAYIFLNSLSAWYSFLWKPLLVWRSTTMAWSLFRISFNCLALLDDVIRAHEMYGKATAIMKGKMARKNTNNIEFKQHIPIKAEILKHHPEIPLHMDFCFINGNPYFTTITGKVNYRTIRRCYSRERKDILKRLQAIVVDRHTKRGFHINEYHADNEFKNI